MSEKPLQIRNSTAEFLIFQAEDKSPGVQVFYENETIWATQEAIATLFDKGRSTITEHLKNIFESGELQSEVVCRKFRHTTQHGATEKYPFGGFVSTTELHGTSRNLEFWFNFG